MILRRIADLVPVTPPASGTGIQLPMEIPEFDVNIEMTPPANGQYYVAGETPIVTVTLKNHADGSDVNPYIYTTTAVGAVRYTMTNHPELTMPSLNISNLFVYGPRSNALPVLTTHSTTDTSWSGTPQQAHPFFMDGSDPGVVGSDTGIVSDSTGFKYQLQPIPADLPAGTYMVRYEGNDYGLIIAE